MRNLLQNVLVSEAVLDGRLPVIGKGGDVLGTLRRLKRLAFVGLDENEWPRLFLPVEWIATNLRDAPPLDPPLRRYLMLPFFDVLTETTCLFLSNEIVEQLYVHRVEIDRGQETLIEVHCFTPDHWRRFRVAYE